MATLKSCNQGLPVCQNQPCFDKKTYGMIMGMKTIIFFIVFFQWWVFGLELNLNECAKVMPKFKRCYTLNLNKNLGCKYILEMSALFNHKTLAFSESGKKTIKEKMAESFKKATDDCIKKTSKFSAVCSAFFSDYISNEWGRIFDYKEKACKEKPKGVLKQTKSLMEFY